MSPQCYTKAYSSHQTHGAKLTLKKTTSAQLSTHIQTLHTTPTFQLQPHTHRIYTLWFVWINSWPTQWLSFINTLIVSRNSKQPQTHKPGKKTLEVFACISWCQPVCRNDRKKDRPVPSSQPLFAKVPLYVCTKAVLGTSLVLEQPLAWVLWHRVRWEFMLFNNGYHFCILGGAPHTKSEKVLFSLAALSLSVSVPLTSLGGGAVLSYLLTFHHLAPWQEEIPTCKLNSALSFPS